MEQRLVMAAPQLSGYVDLALLENAVNSSPAPLGPTVVLDDIGTTWDGGTLSVTGVLAEDRIGIASGGDVSRVGDVISYQGTPIGTVGTGAGETGVGEALLVTFNSAATADSVQAATRALTYQNVSNAPTAQRRLTVVLTDGVGTQTAPGRGGPGFTPYTGAANPFDAIAVATHADPTFGDLDGDGDLDMVTGDDAGVVRYFRNDGTPLAPVYVELTGSENPFNGIDVAPSTAPELVDLDGDGLLDLVTGGTNREPQLRYFRNTGTSTAPVFSQVTGAGDPFSGIATDFGDVVRVSFGDLDGDGDPDMVVGLNGTLTYYRNDGTSTTPSFTAVTGAGSPLDGVVLPSEGPLTPALGDVDGDGDLDLAVGHNNNGQVSYLLNTGTAGSPAFALQSGVDNPFGDVSLANGGAHLSLADLDGDGRLDLAIGDVAGAISYFSRTEYTLMVSVTAQDDPPVLSGGGAAPTAVAGGAGVAVDPNLTIGGGEPGATISRATVMIGAGYVPSEDLLLFDAQDGITGSFDASSGILTLTGTATLAEYQAALRSVRYQNVNADPATVSRAPRSISFSLAPGAYNPANGHFYEFVSAPGITWADARAAALASDLYGMRGYLATITSEDENVFAFSKAQATGWIGGSDEAVEGEWRWMDGPEAGSQFWQGGVGGSAVNGAFVDWGPSQPDNAGGENYAQFVITGTWNDLPGNYGLISGYIIEYGGMPDDPTLSLTSTTSVAVAVVTASPTVSGPTSDSVVYTSPYSVKGTAAAGSLVRVYVDVNGDGLLDEGDALAGTQQLGGSETQFSVGVTLAELAPTRLLVTAEIDDADESEPVVLPALTHIAPPSLAGESTGGDAQTGGAAVVVDPNLTITYNGPTLSQATVIIGAGFVASDDRLLFDDQAGIVGNYDQTTGILTLTGSATPEQYQAALRSVRYQNVNTDPATASHAPRSISFSLAPGAYNPANGHFYEFVSAYDSTWTDARDAAAARDIFGLQGYLATITSAAENVFAFSKVRAAGWIGGSDAESEGVWRWVTGPEAGLQFWQDGVGGSAFEGAFVNWGPGQPDNAYNFYDGTFENYAQFDSNGYWNDLPNHDPWSAPYGPIVGYLVEYGGMAGDPALSLTSTTTLNVFSISDAPTIASPTSETVTSGSTAEVEGTAADGSLVRVYLDVNGDGLLDEGDTLVGSQQLDAGQTSYSVTASLAPNAANRLLVTATVAGAGESAAVAVPTIVSDQLPPASPIVNGPAGPVFVNASTAAISGTAEAGSNVLIYRDGNGDGLLDAGDALVGSQQLGPGESSYGVDVALAQDAVNRFLVVAVDAAGNRSAAAVVPAIVEDSTTPAAPIVLAPTGSILVNGYTATLPGTAEAGSLVEVFDDANGNGQLDEGERVVGSQQLGAGQTRYDVTVPLALNSPNRFVVRSTDAAGNRSPVAVVPTILQDAVAPAAPTLAGPDAPVSIPAASYTLSGGVEAGSLVRVYVDANGNGVVDPGEEAVGSQRLGQGAVAYSITVPLAPGSANRFLVTSTDEAGNTSAPRAVPTITQDSTPPAAPSPGSATGSVSADGATATLTGVAEAGSLVQVYADINRNGVMDFGDTVVGYQQLAPGQTNYSITVPLTPGGGGGDFLIVSVDEAGNASTAVAVAVTADAVAPSVVAVQRLGYHWEPTQIVVRFSEPIDATAAQDVGAYRLVGPRGGAIRIASVRYDAVTNSVTISTASRLYLYQKYHLTIASRAMVDAAGNRPARDHVAQITRANLVGYRPLRPASARLAAVDAVLAAGVRIRRGR